MKFPRGNLKPRRYSENESFNFKILKFIQFFRCTNLNIDSVSRGVFVSEPKRAEIRHLFSEPGIRLATATKILSLNHKLTQNIFFFCSLFPKKGSYALSGV